MKTQQTNYQIKSVIIINALLLMLFSAVINDIYAQTNNSTRVEALETEVYVQGIVKDQSGPLPGANIVLKNSGVGAVADLNGRFKFNTALKSGAILVVSYLGYLPQEIIVDVKNPYIQVIMTEDEIICIGDLNTDRIYKSKRTH